MAKIAVLLPREHMLALAENIACELDLDIERLCVAKTETVEYTARAAASEGAEIIIARGLQATKIKTALDLPVVEIKIKGQEMGLLFSSCVKRMGENIRIGIICFPNMLEDISCFEQILPIKIKQYYVENSDEIADAVENAIKEDVNIIIGGDRVNGICDSLSFPSMFLASTADSLRSAMQRAKEISFATDMEKKTSAHFKTLLDYSFNGIIELDSSDNIIAVNYVGEKILKKDKKHLIGTAFFDLMTASDADIIRQSLDQDESFTAIVTLASVDVVSNMAEVRVDEVLERKIFSFYELERLTLVDENLQREKYLQKNVAKRKFKQLVKNSYSMQKSVGLARSLGHSLVPVLLGGECGTDLASFAESIHNGSLRAEGAFVSFDCSRLSSTGPYLANGQLCMGTNKEAYKVPVDCEFERAIRNSHKGSLYLKNMEHLDLSRQAVILKLIEDNMVRFQTEQYPSIMYSRLILSTNLDFSVLLLNDNLNKELMYILRTFAIKVPSLRERKEDLPKLISDYFSRSCKQYKRYLELTKEALHVLVEYEWPGNERQLELFLSRIVITTNSRYIKADFVMSLLEDLFPVATKVSGATDKVYIYKNPAAMELSELLDKHKGNRKAVAEDLGISTTTLWRRMKKLGVYKKFTH